MDLSLINWITLVGVVLLVVSVPLGQAKTGSATYNVANAMTIVGAVGLLIGFVAWLFG